MYKSTIALLFITIATALINIYEMFFLMPAALKAMVSLLVWLGVFMLPYKNGKFYWGKNDILIKLVILGSFIQVVRSIIFIDEISTVGNNWLTLFGNDVMVQSLIPPLFIYFVHSESILKNIRIVIFGLLFLVVLVFISGGKALPYTMAFSIPFFYYRKTGKEKLGVTFLVLLGLMAGFTSTRILILTTLISLGALFLPRLLPSKIFKTVVLIIFFMPIVLAIWSIKNSQSVFEIILKNIENKELNMDTRTFLYKELFEDLEEEGAVWFGKGALSGYQSEHFETDRETIGRTSNEVYFLHLIIKGGIIYLCLIQIILFLAILNAFRTGNNQITKSFAFTIAGFSCLSFMGDFVGANILHVTVWTMIGFCLSRFWTSQTDEQIIDLIYHK